MGYLSIVAVNGKPSTDSGSYVAINYREDGIGPRHPLFYHERFVPAVAALSGIIGHSLRVDEVRLLVSSEGVGYVQERPAQSRVYLPVASDDGLLFERLDYLLMAHRDMCHPDCAECALLAGIQRKLLAPLCPAKKSLPWKSQYSSSALRKRNEKNYATTRIQSP